MTVKNGPTPPASSSTAAESTTRYDLVVLAASADGVKAIRAILSALPSNWEVPIAIVQHRSAAQPNRLPEVLGSRTTLPVRLVTPGEPLRPGTVYLARPDLHLVVRPDRTLACENGRRIRFLRSSAIPLLESASEVLNGRVIAVVLTGSGTDATDGVQAVRSRGGVVIAQDPATACFSGMPTAAIKSGAVNYILPLEQIGPMLVSLVQHPRPAENPAAVSATG